MKRKKGNDKQSFNFWQKRPKHKNPHKTQNHPKVLDFDNLHILKTILFYLAILIFKLKFLTKFFILVIEIFILPARFKCFS